jgi:uncharacterized protein DUF1844
MSDEDKGFVVKDRRLFDEDGDVRADAQEDEAQAEAPAPEPEPPASEPPASEPTASEPTASEPQEAPQPEAASEPAGEPQGGRPPLPPVDFSGLILSLAHATMMHLGQIPDPMGRPSQPDLELARHTIDTIAMLKEKTQGNLGEDEQKLIDTALTELQMAFVQVQG